jgi:hypothetical protein
MINLLHTFSKSVGVIVSGFALLITGASNSHIQPTIQPASVAVAAFPTRQEKTAIVAVPTARSSPTTSIGKVASTLVSTTQLHAATSLPNTAAGVSQSYVTEDQLAAQLQQATNALRSLIYQQVSAPNSLLATGGVLNNIAVSQRIDQLANVSLTNATVHGVSGLTASDIPTGITASNYLPLIGGTLSGVLTLPFLVATSTTATSTFAGGITGPNSFTVQQGSGRVGIGTTSPATQLEVNGIARAAIQDKGGQVYNARAYGMACDGTTDDTSAFNALLATILPNGVGGGTIWLPGMCRINGAVLFPNDSATPPKQGYVRITGAGSSANGYWNSLPSSPSGLDLRYSGGPKLDSRGAGVLEIDHVTLKDGGSDCTAFINTTNTTLKIHDVAFSGTAAGSTACNDAIVAGGTSTTINGTAAAPFQGYGTTIQNNFSDKIRRGVYGRVYFNGVMITNNTWSSSSGSNLTTAVTSCTNANPTVCTVTGHGLSLGTAYSATFTGATGSWTPINGSHALTPIDANTFSMPVNATSFGALTGSVVFYSGAAIEFDGTGGGASPGQNDSGNIISGNLVEMVSYPYFFKGSAAIRDYFTDNQLFDSGGTTIAFYGLFNSSSFNEIKHGFGNDTSALIASDETNNSSSYTTSAQSQMSVWAQPWTYTNNQIIFKNSGISGPIIQDPSGNQSYMQLNNGQTYLNYTPNGSSTEQVASFFRASATDKRMTLFGTTNSRIESVNSQLQVYSQVGQALFLGDNSNNLYLLGGTINSTRSTGTPSLKMTNTGSLQWSGTSAVSAGSDVGITRNAAGVLEINNGTAGTYRDLQIRTINPTSGNVGIGTTTPWRTLSVTGSVGFDGLSGSVGAGSLCLSANKEVVYNAGSDSCLSSLRATKHDIKSQTADGLLMVSALSPVSFIYNNDASSTVRYGFIAEDAAAVDTHFATHDATGAISGVDDRAIISILVKAVQELLGKVNSLANVVSGFAESFTTKRIQTQELCVGSTCLTEEALKALLDKGGVSAGASTPSSSTSPASSTFSPTTPDTIPPIITLNGANPAHLHIGDTYSDLGATVTDNVDQNIGVHAFVGSTPIEQAVIDTSTTTTYHINYVATDSAGNTATSTRTVIVGE